MSVAPYYAVELLPQDHPERTTIGRWSDWTTAGAWDHRKGDATELWDVFEQAGVGEYARDVCKCAAKGR